LFSVDTRIVKKRRSAHGIRRKMVKARPHFAVWMMMDPPPLVPVMLCPPGYAADQPMPKVRFAKEEIVF